MTQTTDATGRRHAGASNDEKEVGVQNGRLKPEPISPEIASKLCCPRCGSSLTPGYAELRCGEETCASRYPVVGSVPILIDESKSVFSISQIANGDRIFFPRRSAFRTIARKVAPSPSLNSGSGANLRRFGELLLRRKPQPLVLVIGGGILGEGMDELLRMVEVQVVETDITLAERTRIVADAHDLPFMSGSFDGVVAQAVLECVLDPFRCVAEIHRVLASDGLVYAETPFMQQVVDGKYDFTRFTDLGHRRLFRHFSEVDRGIIAGPGTALAWAYQYFLMSFARGPLGRVAMQVFARLTGSWVKHFDPLLNRRPASRDAASGYWFLGAKSDQPLGDRELLTQYHRQ